VKTNLEYKFVFLEGLQEYHQKLFFDIADPVPDPGLSLPPVEADCGFLPSPEDEINLITVCLTCESSAPNFFNTCAATPSPSRIRPRRMCSVPI